MRLPGHEKGIGLYFTKWPAVVRSVRAWYFNHAGTLCLWEWVVFHNKHFSCSCCKLCILFHFDSVGYVVLCCVVCVICCLKMINFTHCAPDVQLGCQTVWILALLKTSWCGLFMLFYLGLIIWDLELIHCMHTQADESVSSLEVKSPVKLANSGKHPEYGTSVIHFVYPEHTNPYCVLKSAMQN